MDDDFHVEHVEALARIVSRGVADLWMSSCASHFGSTVDLLADAPSLVRLHLGGLSLLDATALLVHATTPELRDVEFFLSDARFPARRIRDFGEALARLPSLRSVRLRLFAKPGDAARADRALRSMLGSAVEVKAWTF